MTVQAQIEKERLAAVDELIVAINHKINNPLTTIINYAELLQLMNATKGQTEVVKSIKKILDAALQIKAVTHKLTKIESTKATDYLPEIAMLDM